MKVLMVTEWSPCMVGGVSSQVALLSHWLKKRGHEVEVLYKEGPCKDGSIKLGAMLPLDYHVVPPLFWEVERRIKELRPNIVHVHHSFTPLSVVAVRASVKLGVPCVLTNHSLPPIGDPKRWWGVSYLAPYRWLLNPSVATAVSGPAAKFLEGFLGIRGVRVIPNMVDTEKFRPAERGNFILYLGRLVFRKGLHVLLEAFKSLRREGMDMRLVMAGRGYMEPFLRLMSKDVDDVEFKGMVAEDEKLRLFSSARLFVLPSLAGESFGVVLLEAMSSGTPVVASRTGGIPEVVEDGMEGFLVEPGDAKSLAVAIKAILGSDALWSEMSRRCRNKALKFSVDRVGKMYEKAYLDALSIGAGIRDLHPVEKSLETPY